MLRRVTGYLFIVWCVLWITTAVCLSVEKTNAGMAVEEWPTEEVVMRLPYNPELLIKKKDLTGSAFLVNIIIYKTYHEVAEALLNYDGSRYVTLWGWQTNRNGVCEIHVVEPKYVRGERILGTWGHELGHCVYGRFHK